MRRRRIIHLLVPFMVWALAVSFVAVLPATSQNTGAIISKLVELRDKVRDEHPALENKVKAVIHQIEAGAFNGALNKLENDVIKSILAWVEDPAKREELIGLVDDIIELIEEILCLKPDFELKADPDELAILQGDSATSTIIVKSKKGFNRAVALTITSEPIIGVNATLSPSEITPPPNESTNSTLTIEVAHDAEPDEYVIIVTGTSGHLEHSVEIELEVIALQPARDFSITASPSALIIQQGESNASVIAITSLQGFSEPVDLEVTSDPITGVTTILSPSQAIPPPNSFAISILSVDVAMDAVPGQYTITVAGNSDSLTHSVDISLEVMMPPVPPTPDFSIVAYPDALIIEQGGSATSTLIVVSHNSFSKQVNLTVVSDPIAEVRLVVEPSHVTPEPNGFATSKLIIVAGNRATPDDYVVTVGGASGDLLRTVNISLKIVAERTPPEIVSVLRLPGTPSYNESVTVLASVTDVGSGVKQVMLNYTAGAEWTPINMSLSDEFYRGSIPAFAFNTKVEYRVFALDNANNVGLSNLYSYTVVDPYPPLLRIDSPAQGSYLMGTVGIAVLMNDQNSGGESGFAGAELSINGTVVKTWEPPAPSEPVTYDWNTTAFGPDGVYIIMLKVRDNAGNVAEKSLSVTVDNTLPSATINAPVHGSYLRLSVLIKVTGTDANFDKMEVRIDDTLVRTSTTSGSEILEWNTQNYADGVHSIKLIVYDKAGNQKQAFVNVTVDNTAPTIGTPSWSPEKPAANVDIQINVTVTEPTHGSGIQNVTLWFKNKTLEDWQFIPMELRNGNWTATLSNQTDTEIKFFIEAFDKAGNRAETAEPFKFTVAAPPGFPLAWLLAVIAIIGAGSGGAAYYVRRRRKKGVIASSVPAARSPGPAHRPSPRSLLPPTPSKKPA